LSGEAHQKESPKALKNTSEKDATIKSEKSNKQRR
jgi:hypothetical protein